MATAKLNTGNEAIIVEIEPSEGQGLAGALDIEENLARARDITLRLASGFGETVRDLAESVRPDELELTFGLKISGEAGWVVAKAGSEANFEVKLVWKR